VGPEVLPGQLVLDLPSLEVPADPRLVRRRSHPVVDELQAALAVPAAPPRAWGVWDGEDLAEVYAEESVTRADAAVLRRDAHPSTRERAGCGDREVHVLGVRMG